ncbi:MAG: gliding motility-associated C-terminal domain-containing protein [Ferruginibacter sp.]
MKKYLFLIFFLSLQKNSNAQTDTSFWFAAPDIEILNHPIYGQYDRPIYLRLTSFASAANITISMPANPGFAPINLNIPANSTNTVNLTTWIDLIENSDPANVANKGIYIQSTTDITAYYEVNSTTCLGCNPEFFSLKGRNAIGNEFYVPSQLTWSIDTIRIPNAKAGFDIVATQNNTTVTITPAKALIGHPANVPFTINLNKGQSYACIALYRNGPSMLNGSKVVSDKPVSVTNYEDLLFSDGPCADLAGDQLIPTSIFGIEFAVVRGNLTTRDKVIITASQNNTNIYLNGNAAATATINAGQSYEYDLTPPAPTLNIKTDKAASVYHYTGSGCEVGAAVIPKLTCTGSSSVSLVRSSNGGTASVMLVTKNGNQGNFLMNGVAGIITAADFSPLTGTAGAYVYAKKDVTATMPLNMATTFTNTSGRFQLGFFDLTAANGGCMYGFFSDFKKSNVTTSQTEICKLDSAQLNANGGTTYQWTPATGLSNPNISNPKASPAVTTDYKVIITDIDGCIDSAFVKVVVNASIIDAGSDTSFCSNTTVSYTLQGSGNGAYSWVPAVYLNNPNLQNPIATVNTTTTFYLTVTGSNACSTGIDSVTIYVNPLPDVKTIADTLICSTNTVTLITTGAQTYSWTPTIFLSNPNIANPVYSGNLSQTYYVTGTGLNGCKASDTVRVNVNMPMVFQQPPNKSICSQSSVVLDGYNGTLVDYLWSPGTYLSSTTIINPVANPPSSTSYNVLITDRACNTSSNFTVQVVVGAKPVITAGKSNDIDCANPSAVLHASGGISYSWTPSTGLSSTTIPDPVATPTNTQKYIVLVTDASGCFNSDSVTVFSGLTASLARYMPNAFTPNGDGKNDCYGLKNWFYIKKLEFRIFNRYGEQVFATSNPSACWDGNYKGKRADPGTYVFYIKAETDCGTEEQKGSFLLIR